jgi:hypothetical protein
MCLNTGAIAGFARAVHVTRSGDIPRFVQRRRTRFCTHRASMAAHTRHTQRAATPCVSECAKRGYPCGKRYLRLR